MCEEQENEIITVDPKRVSAWNRWFQERQQKLKKLKETDPLFRDNDLIKHKNNGERNPDQNDNCSKIDSELKDNRISDISRVKTSNYEKNDHTIKNLADALREASLREKDKKIISYDCFLNQSNTKLNEWLEEFKPLKIRQKCKDVGAIVIYGFIKDENQLSDYKKKFEMSASDSLSKNAKLIKEWNSITEKNDAIVNYETICDLARKYDILGGKWLFSVHHHTVNIVWGNICREINKAAASASRRYKAGSGHNERMEGIPCIAAKISDGREVSNYPKGTRRDNSNFMILVYTTNFMDDKTIFDVEKALRKCGIHSSMSYKPDLFSVLGIYRQNRFKLRPTIYHSSWVLTKENAYDVTLNEYESGHSIIESSINEFKVACKARSDEPTTIPHKSKSSSPRPSSETSCTETKGKLGRNIVLQVLKRKEYEANQSKPIETPKQDPMNSESEDGATVCVGNVPHNMTDDMIKNSLETKFGEVMKVERRSVCYVTFKEKTAAKNIANSSEEHGGKYKVGSNMLDITGSNTIELEN